MLKTKLSLERTWTKCMAMWEEMIEKHWKRGVNGEDLKDLYLANHRRMAMPRNMCYFCDYAFTRRGHDCNSCPGRLVDKNFDCYKPSYYYQGNPKAFYRKLVKLNKKRKQGKCPDKD